MSTFTDPLVVSPCGDGRRWRLVRAFSYHVGELPSRDVIRVPVGFVTDFASVPRFAWSLFSPWGRYGKAAVVHDWLYVIQDRSRAAADAVFLEAMEVLGVPAWKRRAMFWAVRWFGGRAWRRNVRDEG